MSMKLLRLILFFLFAVFDRHRIFAGPFSRSIFVEELTRIFLLQHNSVDAYRVIRTAGPRPLSGNSSTRRSTAV